MVGNRRAVNGDPVAETNLNSIIQYLHCSMCMRDIPDGVSPALYQRVNVGFTKIGMQVWCVRHGVNIIHVDFDGHKHRADMTRSVPAPADPESLR